MTWIFGGGRGNRSPQLPAVNIREDETCFSVEVISLSFKKEDFKVHVENDILTASAENRQENTEGGKAKEYSRREYRYNSFTRSFCLPGNVKEEALSAKYEADILKIQLLKVEQRQKASRQINIE